MSEQQISGSVVKFRIPDTMDPDTAWRLCRLADANGLNATDIVKGAHKFLAGDRLKEHWVEMLESIGLDPETTTDVELGETADNINRVRIRKLQTMLEERNRRILEARGDYEPEPEWEPTTPGKTTVKRKTLFGHPATSVVRWMGKEGWSFGEARSALGHLDIDITEATIKTQLQSGVKGKRGEPAPITEDQADVLYDAVESAGN